MILEKNNLQTVQRWTKSYIELIALYVHPKNSNHLRSHLRAIMALDHSRLGLENKFLENKSGRIFCVRQVYFTKSCQQVWGRVNQPFILFIHHIWGETVPWGAVFIIQTSDRMQYFTIFQYQLHSFNIQDDRSTCGLLAKPSKIFQNHLYGQPVLTFAVWAVLSVWMNINRVTLQHKEWIFNFYLMVLLMCNLQKCLTSAAFWVLLQAMFINNWKQTAQWLKLRDY